MRRFFVLSFLIGPVVWAADASDLDFVVASSLPPQLNEYLRSATGTEGYALSSRLNPFYLQADFNGDGSRDIAILIDEKHSTKRGILIVHLGIGEHFVIGAGNTLGNGGDDFSFMDAWRVFERGPVSRGAHGDGDPPSLLGDALLVMKTEAASAVLYWTGESYEWYQQGD